MNKVSGIHLVVPGPSVLALIAFWQIFGGLWLMYDHDAALATALFDVHRTLPLDELHHRPVALVGLAGGLLGLLSILLRPVYRAPSHQAVMWDIGYPQMRFAMMALPSLVMSLVSGILGLIAILESQYGDGVIRPRAFIGLDQQYLVLFAVWHFVAYLNFYAPGWTGILLRRSMHH